MPHLLSTHALGRRVDARWLWRGLDLSLPAGETLAITGPSGSGKTLLLRALAGLEPATEGAVSFDGRGLDVWPMPAYRSQVIYLPQRPVMVADTVEDDLRLPFGLRTHRGKPYPADRVRRMLAAVDRGASFLRAAGDSLSGGEGQIVAVLRALLLEPRVLLLDEPTASLDDATARAIERLVADWLAEDGDRAAVWTSHREDQLDRVARQRLRLGNAA